MKILLTALTIAIAALPLPALAADYPPCTETRTDQCTQVTVTKVRKPHRAKKPMPHTAGPVSPKATKRIAS